MQKVGVAEGDWVQGLVLEGAVQVEPVRRIERLQ